ncbi:hypothetical protein MMC22_008459, partial [Lobaria immixta]|nr:hypothetical protein [Lobaria immixta]
MSRQCGNAELEWRYETWRKQENKEVIRLHRTYNYELHDLHDLHDEGELGNINENEYDGGWAFPVSQEEVREQLMDINERVDREIESPEYDFFMDRPSRHEEAGTPIAEEGTENEVEAV